MVKWTRVVCAAPFAALLAVTAFAGDAQGGESEVVARVGTTDVNAEDVRAYLVTLDPRVQAAIASNPAVAGQAARMFIAQQLALKEALAQKWEQQPAVAAQLERLRQGAISELYLQSVSKPPEGFPSDAEAQSAYDANKTAFLVPRQFRIAQIFIADPKDSGKAADDKARRKLDDVTKKLKQKGADFAAIAQASSDDAESAKQGGELAWLPEPQIVPPIRSIVLGLGKDAVSEPMQLDDGWHIVKLLDTKAAFTRPLAEVRDQIVQQLRAERATENRKAYLGKLLEKTPPAINEIALAKALGKPDAATAPR